VYEALASGRQRLVRIHVSREIHSPKLREILELARRRGVPVDKEDRSVIDRLAEGAPHQGIVAIAGEFAYAALDTLFAAAAPLVVVLDGVEDPHNLGAVIRTAEACGATGIVVPERHAAPLSSAVAKASAGALAYVPVVRVTNLVSTLELLKRKGFWIAGIDPSGERLWTEFDYTVPIALVLGGEHRGIRRLVRVHCDVLVRLPMLGRIESLNISVCAGVLLYEVARQRSVALSQGNQVGMPKPASGQPLPLAPGQPRGDKIPGRDR
jgi:23S rRNA (guanosine2251-2'-O)-methyltransferase